MTARRARRALAALWLALAALGVPGRPAEAQPSEETLAQDETTATPIKHLVTLMQENHSFDNYFGTYPGADGPPDGTCQSLDPDDPGGRCVAPYHLGSRSIVDLGHNAVIFRRQYAGGSMDGFASAFRDARAEAGEQAMGFYDDRDLPYYWNIADDYVLFDRFFTSAWAGSIWNHFFWVAAHPGNPENDLLDPDGFEEVTTIFDRLEERGLSWKFYVENYDPGINFRTPGDGDRSSQVVWVPLLSIPRFLDRPHLNERIVPLEQYFADLDNDELPAVSYIVPSGASEHPPGSIQAGERFVRRLITALMRSRAWERSAFTWTYDDWGGWFDHVRPPQVDEYGYGFRAPALLVSPYAKKGHIDSSELDFTSILAFIEDNWGIEPLTERDAQANSIASAFDFDQPPREPVLLTRERNPDPPAAPKTGIVYLSYGSVGLVSLVLGGAGFVASRRRVRRR